MKYAYYDEITGMRLFDDTLDSNIPESSIPISDEQWINIFTQDSRRHKIIDSVLVFIPKTQEEIDTENCNIAQQEVEDELQNILRSIAIEKYIEKQKVI